MIFNKSCDVYDCTAILSSGGSLCTLKENKGLKCAIVYFYAANTTSLAKHTSPSITQKVDQKTFIEYNQGSTKKTPMATSP